MLMLNLEPCMVGIIVQKSYFLCEEEILTQYFPFWRREERESAELNMNIKPQSGDV